MPPSRPAGRGSAGWPGTRAGRRRRGPASPRRKSWFRRRREVRARSARRSRRRSRTARSFGLLPRAALERAAEGELQALEFVVVAFAQRERVADRDRADRRAPHQRDAGGYAQLVGVEGV